MSNEQETMAADLAALDATLKAASADEAALPSVEDYAPLRAAREHVSRIEAELSAAKARRREVADKLGIKPKTDTTKLDRVAAELLAAGKSTEAVAEFEAVASLVRRLETAREIAGVKADAEYQKAIAASDQAIRAYLSPADKAIALAHVELCRAERRRAARVADLRARGFLRHVPASGPGNYSADAYGLREHFRRLVECGALAETDVADLISD